MVWTVIEPGLAIVASSLATIRPLLRAMRIRGFESTEDSNKRSHDQALQQIQHSPRRLVPRSPYGLDDITLTTTMTTEQARVGESDKSEVLVIQGQVDDGRRSASSGEDDRSLVQIHDLEAQNQENVLTGIGGGRLAGRRRDGMM